MLKKKNIKNNHTRIHLEDQQDQTVLWHLDDLKASHANSETVDKFIEWIKITNETIGEVKSPGGKVQNYIGMKLDYSGRGQT